MQPSDDPLRDQVRALVDRLPSQELLAARRYLEYLQESSDPYAHLDEADVLEEEARAQRSMLGERALSETRRDEGQRAAEVVAELRRRR